MTLVFPERFADESGYGYIQRGLETNGLSWGWLRSKTGIAAGILPSYEKAAAIMDLFHGRLFEHDFLSNQKRDDGRSYLRYYKHEFLGRWQVLGRYQKVCPKCLIQRGYVRKLWDIDLVSVCPVHRTRLIRQCANCNCEISWFRKSHCFCRCGLPFTDQLISGNPSEFEILWSGWLEQRLDFDCSADLSIFRGLEHLSLGLTFQVVKILGLGVIQGDCSLRSLNAHCRADRVADVIHTAVIALENAHHANSKSKVDFTHQQELGYERLFQAAATLREVSHLSTLYEKLTGRAPQKTMHGSKQLTLNLSYD